MAKNKPRNHVDVLSGNDHPTKPYNRYNIYYKLERELLLQSKMDFTQRKDIANSSKRSSSKIMTGYEGLQLPDLPFRYRNLVLAHDWCMPGNKRNVKRSHKKSHGLASFQQIAKVVADGWKSIDDETLAYVTRIAELLKQRHKELQNCLKELKPAVTASSPASSSLPKPRSVVHTKENHRTSLEQKQTDQYTSHQRVSDMTVASSTNTGGVVSGYQSRTVIDQNAQRMAGSQAKMREVDLADHTILAMWHLS